MGLWFGNNGNGFGRAGYSNNCGNCANCSMRQNSMPFFGQFNHGSSNMTNNFGWQGNRNFMPSEVRFEPLDQNTLNQIKGSLGINQELPIQNDFSQKKDSLSENNIDSQNFLIPTLESFIQDSRNASIFYGHLVNLCSDAFSKETLQEICNDCKFFVERGNSLYNLKRGNEFLLNENVKINDKVNFVDGISLALKEECFSIKQLSKMYDISDADITRFLNTILPIKISNLNLLNYIACINSQL